MGIVGNQPETGLRVTLIRKALDTAAAAEVRAVYRGKIVASDGAAVELEATIDTAGAVAISAVSPGVEANLKRVTQLLRTIVRECERDGRAQMPAKIVRWWGEK